MLFFRPDLIDYESLKKSNAMFNLQNAFNVAEQELGLSKLLDPEGTLILHSVLGIEVVFTV